MEVQYDQEPFARPRYRDIVTEARHEEQQGETKSATDPRRGTRMVPAIQRLRHALPAPALERRGIPISADRG